MDEVVDGTYPNLWTRVLAVTVHFLGTIVITWCLARRTAFESLSTFKGWRNLSVTKFAMIGSLASSLLFMILTGVLNYGGTLTIFTACRTAIEACKTVYSVSKVFIYIFLSERAWIVWSNNGATSGRFRSPLYLFCLLCITAYIPIALVGVVRAANGEARVAGHPDELRCWFGFFKHATPLVLSYDCIMTVFLTSFFVFPLVRGRLVSPQLRRMAYRTTIASFVALTTSTINFAVLTSLDDTEPAWACLLSCGLDVTINALVLFNVTTSRAPKRVSLTPTVVQHHVAAAPPRDEKRRLSEPRAVPRINGWTDPGQQESTVVLDFVSVHPSAWHESLYADDDVDANTDRASSPSKLDLDLEHNHVATLPAPVPSAPPRSAQAVRVSVPEPEPAHVAGMPGRHMVRAWSRESTSTTDDDGGEDAPSMETVARKNEQHGPTAV